MRGKSSGWRIRKALRSLAAALDPLESRCLLSTIALAPLADAYVRAGVYTTVNYGQTPSLQVKGTTNPQSDYYRDSYLTFDIAGVSGNITSATLRLFGRLNMAEAMPVTAFGVSNTSWSESGITNANKPPAGNVGLDSTSVASVADEWHDWNLSGYVWSERAAGRNRISVALRGGANTAAFAQFASNNAGVNGPELVVTTNDTTPAGKVAAPTGVSASAKGSRNISLRWSAVSGAGGYQINRRAGSGSWQTVAGLTTSTSFIDSALLEKTKYDYQIFAVGPDGASPGSTVVCHH